MTIAYGLRPSVRARHGTDTQDLLFNMQVAPFHERTPIHALQQGAVLSQSQDGARRFEVLKCGPGHKHTLRVVLLADRAHVISDLRQQPRENMPSHSKAPIPPFPPNG